MLLENIAAAVVLAGANYADYATTRQAIDRGGVEANVLIGPRGERLTPIKAATVAGETTAFCLIRRKHKKTAWAFVGGIVVTNLLIARSNAQVSR